MTDGPAVGQVQVGPLLAEREDCVKLAELGDPGPLIRWSRLVIVLLPPAQPLDAALKLAEERESALTTANRRLLEQDGAIVELQAVLLEALARWHPKRQEIARWRERLGLLWPKGAP